MSPSPTAPQTDSVEQLEHDHRHLSRLVDGMRESLREAIRGERSAEDLRADLNEFVALVQEELFEHFGKEEEGLFPWLIERLPDTRDRVASLERGHDRICGVASRLQYIAGDSAVDLGAQLDTLVTLFARFDAYFTKHARDEWELLMEVKQRLEPDQRKELGRLLDEI
ncbi:MAG: hemerythrin domain-containing protein [Deltaproteobacteria bacterium]|nr:MAG: hemerythrin domain-containing protein [Deltaproteobacteria bacterium]